VWRQPALVLAEVAWRWSWGLASTAVLAVCARAYLQSITVTNADLVELRSNVPVLVADAINRMLEGSAAILARLAAVAVPAIALMWVVTASLGSAAVLKALLPQTADADAAGSAFPARGRGAGRHPGVHGRGRAGRSHNRAG